MTQSRLFRLLTKTARLIVAVLFIGLFVGPLIGDLSINLGLLLRCVGEGIDLSFGEAADVLFAENHTGIITRWILGPIAATTILVLTVFKVERLQKAGLYGALVGLIAVIFLFILEAFYRINPGSEPYQIIFYRLAGGIPVWLYSIIAIILISWCLGPLSLLFLREAKPTENSRRSAYILCAFLVLVLVVAATSDYSERKKCPPFPKEAVGELVLKDAEE